MATAKTIGELTAVPSLTLATQYMVEQGLNYSATHTQLATLLTANGFQRYDQANTSKPAFLVYPSGNLLNVTGNSTEYTVAWDTESYDQGNDFAANTFTAPVTGIYHFHAKIRIANMTAAADNAKVTITAGGVDHDVNYGALNDMPGDITLPNEIQVSLTAAQTAVVKVTVDGEASDVVDLFGAIENTVFWGRLVA